MLMNIKNYYLGDAMLWIKNYFSIYVTLLILVIGLYMAFVQSSNLISQDLRREGQVSRVVGYVYLVIGVCGLIICMK